jgi:hypothetical protein
MSQIVCGWPECGKQFEPGRRSNQHSAGDRHHEGALYCSRACQQKAYRHRRATVTQQAASAAATVTPRAWFVRRPGYDGPPIELTCGHYTKAGRFIPKNVKLTAGPWRLSKPGRQRLKMVGDPSTDEREIYAAMMAAKRGRP